MAGEPDRPRRARSKKQDGGSTGKDKYLLSSANNMLGLLDTLCHYDSLSLAELSRKTGLDKASLFRMMYTLEKHDLVTKNADARYSLGLRLLYYGNIVAERQSLVDVARPAMQRFSLETGRSAHLGRMSRNRVTTLHIERAQSDIQVTMRIGMNAPLYATAMGRAILSNVPDEALRNLVASFSYKQYAPTSLQDEQELRDVIYHTRKNGFATDINERFPGFGSIAAPIWNHQGVCESAVGVVTFAQDIEEHEDELASQVIALAQEISEALGYRNVLNSIVG